MLHIPGLYILNTEDRGRGVFTSENLSKDDVIEIAPVIVMPKKDRKQIHNSHLHDYYFSWGKKRKGVAIVLGYGSLYNHSAKPNCTFELDLDNENVIFKSIRKISAGSELLIDYEEGLEGSSQLWF